MTQCLSRTYYYYYYYYVGRIYIAAEYLRVCSSRVKFLGRVIHLCTALFYTYIHAHIFTVLCVGIKKKKKEEKKLNSDRPPHPQTSR